MMRYILPMLALVLVAMTTTTLGIETTTILETELEALEGRWTGNLCGLCGCPAACTNTYAVSGFNVTFGLDGTMTFDRPSRQLCTEFIEGSSVVHTLDGFGDDGSCIHVPTGDKDHPGLYSIQHDTVHLTLAYAPELSYCPSLPYVPACSCSSYGTSVSGFYATLVRADLGLEPPKCHFAKNEMVITNPVQYIAKAAVVIAIITTIIEWFIYKFLSNVP